MSAVSQAVNAALNEPLKIDIGCGANKQPGFIGIDQYALPGVDLIADLRHPVWVFEGAPEALQPRLDRIEEGSGFYRLPANSVDEAHCSHFLEHLTNLNNRWERVNFFNELYRILKPGASCRLVIPHWNSSRYYGDPTHKEPFSEWGFFYLLKSWRLGGKNAAGIDCGPNAPHADVSVNPNGYSCDFDVVYGYNLHPAIAQSGRSADYQSYAVSWYKEACTDIIATLTKPAQSR